MKREQFIELAQFIIAWTFLALFIIFVVEASFLDFILKYRLYLLIVSLCYFYYYSIKYETDKKSNSIRKILIRGNLYLFCHIFFRPLLNISHELFIALGIILFLLRESTKIKSKIRIVIQLLGTIVCFLILTSGLIYLYPEAPDIKGFSLAQQCQLQSAGIDEEVNKNEAYLQISDNRKTEDIIITPYLNKNLSGNLTISYPSLQKIRNENVFIQDSLGNIILLIPQSQINVDINDNIIKNITIVQGEMGFFTGMLYTGNILYSGNNENINDKQKELVDKHESLYLNKLVNYLKQQISENNYSISNSNIMQNIDGQILNILAKIFPANFTINLKNYKEFQKYFSLIEDNNQLYNLNKEFTEGNTQTSKDTWNIIKDKLDKQNGRTYLLNI